MAHGDKLHPLQQKFLEHAALQCGICTPGFLIAAKDLLAKNRTRRGRNPLRAGREPVSLHRL
jgi:aerobic-type carbon monoxide dehydrogenase small subunit (CoxS/CutS family)